MRAERLILTALLVSVSLPLAHSATAASMHTSIQASKAVQEPSNSDSLKASLEKVELLRTSRSYFVADTAVNKLLAKHPNDLDVVMAAARLHRDMGLAARAEAEYITVLQRKPDFPEACSALSSIYLQKLDMPRALNYAHRAYNINPTMQNRLDLASALLAAGKFREANEELRKLLKSNPNNPQVQYSAYELALSLNESPSAQKHLEAAVNMAPGRSDWLIELSDLYKDSGDYLYARQALERALASDPTSVDALNKLAVIYEFYSHDFDQATDQYRRILLIDPDSVSALAGLDRCKVKKNDIAGALRFQLQNLFSSTHNFFNKNGE